MRRNELVEALRAIPFRPFRLRLSDGGTFDVRHPEMLMITRHSAIVGILSDAGDRNGGNGDSGHHYPAIERSTTIDLLHITAIEQLQDR